MVWMKWAESTVLLVQSKIPSIEFYIINGFSAYPLSFFYRVYIELIKDPKRKKFFYENDLSKKESVGTRAFFHFFSEDIGWMKLLPN